MLQGSNIAAAVQLQMNLLQHMGCGTMQSARYSVDAVGECCRRCHAIMMGHMGVVA